MLSLAFSKKLPVEAGGISFGTQIQVLMYTLSVTFPTVAKKYPRVQSRRHKYCFCVRGYNLHLNRAGFAGG